MTSLALTLCGVAAVAWLAVGALALLSPQHLSQSYGVRAKDDSAIAYVRAAGARDVLLGIFLATMTYMKDVHALLVICVGGIAIALADFLIAFRVARTLRSEHGAHLGGAVGFAVLVVLLLRG